MRSPARQLVLAFALATAGTTALLLGTAHAAPPLARWSEALERTPASHSEAPVAGLPQRHLDLTVPAVPPSAERPAAAAFPVMQRHSFGVDAVAHAPTAGASDSLFAGRPMSRPEALARNFSREGLPVARLFQSDNALVHLGLSPKGKPGLWIVEKLH